jgi:hypothetical protein
MRASLDFRPVETLGFNLGLLAPTLKALAKKIPLLPRQQRFRINKRRRNPKRGEGVVERKLFRF